MSQEPHSALCAGRLAPAGVPVAAWPLRTRGRPAAARECARRGFALASRSQRHARMFVRVASAAVVGIEAAPIDVEVDVGVGLPCCNIVGLADAGIREGRRAHPRRARQQRLQAAAAPDHGQPRARRPAQGRRRVRRPDRGRHAVRRPAWSTRRRWTDTLFVGELALDGTLRPVRGVLPIAAWARGARRAAAGRAARQRRRGRDRRRRATCRRRANLGALVALLRGERAADAPAPAATPASRAGAPRPRRRRWIWPTCAGRRSPRRALEIAAAGGHNLLFVGPPGLGEDDARPAAARDPAAARVRRGAGDDDGLFDRRPARRLGAGRARGRSARRTTRCRRRAWSGGGADGAAGRDLARAQRRAVPRRAARVPALGARDAAPAARGPRRHHRARRGAASPTRRTSCWSRRSTPARAGTWAARSRTCTCSAAAVAAYRSRLSGPLLDRIDLHVDVPALPYRELAHAEPGESSAAVRDARRGGARAPAGARPRAGTPACTSTELRRGGAARRRRPRAAGAGGRAARPVGARHHPRPPRGAHHRRPGGQRRRSAPRTSPRPSSTASSINPTT